MPVANILASRFLVPAGVMLTCTIAACYEQLMYSYLGSDTCRADPGCHVEPAIFCLCRQAGRWPGTTMMQSGIDIDDLTGDGAGPFAAEPDCSLANIVD